MTVNINRETQIKLVSLLNGHVDSILIFQDPVQQIDSICFLMKSGSAIKLSNEMVELDERIEEGTILVEELSSTHYKEAIKISIHSDVSSENLTFYTHTKYGNDGICGLTFLLCGKEHSIFVGAAPSTLIFRTELIDDKRQPEFPLEEYERLI